MSTSLPRNPPGTVPAGDTIEFLVTVPSDYASWTGSARLTGAGQMAATSCAAEGADFHIKFQGTASAPTVADGTSSLPAGQYTLTVWASNGNDRVTVAQWPVTMTADLATGEPALAHAIKMLDIVESAIIARVSGNNDGGIDQYTIDGTSVVKIPIEQLERLRNKYSAEVAALQNGASPIRRINFAMAPAGGTPFGFRGRCW